MQEIYALYLLLHRLFEMYCERCVAAQLFAILLHIDGGWIINDATDASIV